MKLQAEVSQLARLFPSYIVVDSVLSVIGAGPSIQRRFPGLSLGSKLHEHFRSVDEMQAAPLSELVAQLGPLTISEQSSGAKLFGEVLVCESGFFLALRVAADQYLKESSNLEISDFALDDPAIHGLLLFSLQRALLEDQREVSLELVRARQKSIDLLDRISRVAGYIAHDFNNFLSIIRLNCDLLIKEAEMKQRSLRLLDIIKGTAARGSAITRSFMALSHQRDDTRLPVLIDGFIRDNIPFLSTIVGSRVSINTSLGAGEAQILASPVALLNCIMNLMINARDAIAGTGRITIETCIKQTSLRSRAGEIGELTEFVAITIADSGSGMESDVLSRAFEPLYSTKPNGNGLGLASVLEFARGIGGDACIDSNEDEGARIYLYLPTMQAVPSLAVVSNHSSDDLADPRSGILPTELLVVDDEPYALEALAELLELEGYCVTTCGTAADALAELAVKPYQMLLTDVIMPGESGPILARRAQAMQPNIKVILMSGYVPDGENLEDDWMFIRKPIATDVLSDMICFSLSRRP